MNTIPQCVKSAGPSAVAIYSESIGKGTSPRLAEALALRRPPGTGTCLSRGATVGGDSTFMNGRRNGEDLAKMPPWQRQRLLAQAKKAGIDINGKVFIGSLADKRLGGDPEAWVDSPSDIVRVAKKRNKNAVGAGHNYEAPQKPPPPPKAVSEAALQSEMAAVIAENPDAGKNIKKLRKETEERLCPHWKTHLLKG